MIAAIHDQVAAGLDVITDGEQTRLDFNLSFYGYLEGIEREAAPAAPLRPAGARPARAPRGSSASSRAPRGLGVVEEFERLRRLAPAGPVLKASVPGPYTLSGRLVPNDSYPDRWRARRGAAADRPRRARRARRGGLPRDHRRRAVDELLRAPRGPDALRRHLQPHGRAGRGRAGSRRTSASATTRAAPSGRGATRRCSPRSSSSTSTRSTSRWRAASSPRSRSSRTIAERLDVGGRHRRREELLDRAAGGGCRARAPLPASRAGGAAVVRDRTAA